MRNPLFTGIVHTYNRPTLLKIAVEALRRQTYTNLEIILISNGATPEVVDYLNEVALIDDRIKLVHFSENQYTPDDPVKYIDVCWNAALAEATGEYVWVQQDDDLLAEDYVEKMVALFQGNSECTTAAGMPVSIGIDGQVNEFQLQDKNKRSKYTPGRDLVEAFALGNRELFSAPGTIFTIKRDVLLSAGGYHRAIELSQLYGIVPFGVTGFDPNAIFYWRHHDGQQNKQTTRKGWISINESMGLLKDWQLNQRWSVFGTTVAQNVIRCYKNEIYYSAATSFLIHCYAYRPLPAFRIMKTLWFHPGFWASVAVHAGKRKYWSHAISPILKSSLKHLFKTMPALGKLTPALSRLRDKSERWI